MRISRIPQDHHGSVLYGRYSSPQYAGSGWNDSKWQPKEWDKEHYSTKEESKCTASCEGDFFDKTRCRSRKDHVGKLLQRRIPLGEPGESVRMDVAQLPALLQQQAQFFEQTVEEEMNTLAQAMNAQADRVPVKEKELTTTKRAFTMLPNYSGKVEEYENGRFQMAQFLQEPYYGHLGMD